MKNTNSSSERGQVLVLIILALVGLLGFAALAIDGGMIYSDRRINQNAADASAFAGAAAIKQIVAETPVGDFDCDDYLEETANWDLAVTGAKYRADSNGFHIGEPNDDVDERPDGQVWLECNPGGNLYLDVHTQITRQVSTSLMHLFYNGPAVNTVDSVVRIYPHNTLAADTAILALRDIPDCESNDKCLTVNGSIDVQIDGGIVASNSVVEKSGGGGGNNGLFSVTIDGATPADAVLYGDAFNPGPSLENAPNYPGTQLTETITIPTYLENILRARCNSLTEWAADANNQGNVNRSGVIRPGKYNEIRLNAADRVTLEPGLYCVNSVSILSNGNGSAYSMFGENVTFFMDTDAGGFTISSSAKVKLSAPTDEYVDEPISCNPSVMPDLNLDPIQGLLIWSAAQGTNNPMPEISLNGSAISDFTGSVVAPYTRVSLHGNVNGSDTLVYHLQVIAFDVWLAGNSTLVVDYDNDFAPRCGGMLDQHQ